MMSRSRDFRARAWESLRTRYWRAFGFLFVALLLAELALSPAIGVYVASIIGISFAAMVSSSEVISILTAGAVLIYMLLIFVTCFFAVYQIDIGIMKYFIINTEEKPDFENLFAGFKKGYLNIAKTYFFILLKTLLWMLLFYFPAIYKAFEYSMIPYILAEDPTTPTKEAFAKSRAMMHGNRWRLFKLQFSFIGWYLLGFFTCGIGIYFVMPYQHAAIAEFYKEVKANASSATEQIEE